MWFELIVESLFTMKESSPGWWDHKELHSHCSSSSTVTYQETILNFWEMISATRIWRSKVLTIYSLQNIPILPQYNSRKLYENCTVFKKRGRHLAQIIAKSLLESSSHPNVILLLYTAHSSRLSVFTPRPPPELELRLRPSERTAPQKQSPNEAWN